MDVKAGTPTKTPASAPAKRKLVRYGGYYTNTVPAHSPELTETGPGTPMGEYMRRFWHPICMSVELTDTPRFLKIMGEELVAFRDAPSRPRASPTRLSAARIRSPSPAARMTAPACITTGRGTAIRGAIGSGSRIQLGWRG